MTTNTIRSRIALDRTRQISPQIVEYLRERILALELEPGATLSRIGLQQQFGLSQTPVRDALLKLEEEGLVTVYPQHATLVSRINIDLARQTHFMRRAIESDAVRILAEQTSMAIVADLRRANEHVAEQAEKADYAGFLLADRTFHHVIFEHADLLELWPILRRHSGHLDRLRRLNLPSVGMERVVDLHGKIIDGIAAGDPGAAADAMREHLSKTLAMLEWVQANYPNFIEVR
ncbi:MAG TPA: GntR family transcriptional regulator [Devosia sp.]|nr:GntR family transcriptional regulator [Devosia sp.]